MLKTCLAALAAAALAATLAATPTRVAALDDGRLLVADDWDATVWYSLAPNFHNRLYYQAAPGGGVGWAFLDLGKRASLVLWWNKPFEAGSLYEASGSQGGPLGLSLDALDAPAAQDWAPRERRLAVPPNLAALGLAVPVSDALNLAFCFRYAAAEHTRGQGLDSGQGFGASLASFADGGGGLYNPLSTTAYADRQSSSGMVLSPQFTWSGESFVLSAKGEFIWAGLDNSHREDLLSADGTGSLSQTLRERGTLSWAVKPHLRWSLEGGSSLVLRGSWEQLGFEAEHRVSGSFSGGGFNASQLAGYDHADGTQALRLRHAEAMAGWVRPFAHGGGVMVLGLGVFDEVTEASQDTQQVRSGASDYNDLVPAARRTAATHSLRVPLLMGAEAPVKPWLKLRGMVTRDVHARVEDRTVDEAWDAAGARLPGSTRESGGDQDSGWRARVGAGLDLGSFQWDLAFSNSLLGSAEGAAFANPLLESSFAFAF